MTLYPFNPSPSANFQFQPTLDSVVYNVIVNWNLFGERYYINIYTLQGRRIATLPLIGSPPDSDINIIGGYFTTSRMVYRAASATIEIGP